MQVDHWVRCQFCAAGENTLYPFKDLISFLLSKTLNEIETEKMRRGGNVLRRLGEDRPGSSSYPAQQTLEC